MRRELQPLSPYYIAATMRQPTASQASPRFQRQPQAAATPILRHAFAASHADDDVYYQAVSSCFRRLRLFIAFHVF